jgi:CTP:molybdopterin cytidylyltransferase MocA
VVGPVWALVLAGRPNDGRLDASAGDLGWEALIDVAGVPMAARVLAALGGARSVAGGVLVGPAELDQALPAGFVRVDPAGDTIANLTAGLAVRPPTVRHVLVATSDIPLVTSTMIDSLIEACGDRSLDVYFPVVRREVAEARFPGVRRTYVRLRDGSYTAGNLFLVRPEVLVAGGSGEGLLARMVRWRKAPWRMALALGPGLLLGLLTASLDLAGAERAASRRLGVRGRAVVTPFAEVGVDVDKPGDLALCREALSHAART